MPQTQTHPIDRTKPNVAWTWLLLGVLVFLTVGYFQNIRPGWNVSSVYSLTRAIVESGTLRIDDYHDHPRFPTFDKAYFEGHFYSDKSPVTAFLGVPAFYLFRQVALAGERTWDENYFYIYGLYWTTWLTIGPWSALFAILLARMLARYGLAPAAAAAAAGLWFMATPLVGYAILFFNYLPAAAMALGGFTLIEPFLAGRENEIRRPLTRLFGGGVLLGLASWTLSTFALLALILTGTLIWRTLRPGDRPDRAGIAGRLARLWPWAVGGIVGASGFAFYSLAVFGEITSPYRYEYLPLFREAMQQGLMGATWPDPLVMLLITFHPFQGLFLLFPATLIAALGAVRLLGEKPRRLAALAALLFLAGLILYNSGYYLWWGGWAYAPRHLNPALALLPLGLTPWLRGAGNSSRNRKAVRTLALLVMIVGAAYNMMAVSLDPQTPPGLPDKLLFHPENVEDWPSPFFNLVDKVLGGETMPNWGTMLGLRGVWSLVPLAAAWLLGAGIMLHLDKKREDLPRRHGTHGEG